MGTMKTTSFVNPNLPGAVRITDPVGLTDSVSARLTKPNGEVIEVGIASPPAIAVGRIIRTVCEASDGLRWLVIVTQDGDGRLIDFDFRNLGYG